MRRKKIILIILIVLLIVCFGILILAFFAAQKVKAPQNDIPESLPVSQTKNERLIGVTFSPKTTNISDFLPFFTKAKEVGNTLGWYGDILQLSDTRQAPYSITQNSAKNDLEQLIIVNYYSQGERQLIRPLSENKDKYIAGMQQYISKYKPKYFGIGIEINWMYRDAPNDFNGFVAFFDEAAEKLKSISPETKIFTVFQLEMMKGLQGGLYGKTNSEATQWDLFSRFPKADIIAFTTYPGLIYKNPEDIPQDYYSNIKQFVNKDVIFTEIGWSRTTMAAGWVSSPEKQAQFINTFFALTKDVNPKVIIWSFLYDPPTFNIAFDSMGLLGENDSTDLGFEAWKKEFIQSLQHI